MLNSIIKNHIECNYGDLIKTCNEGVESLFNTSTLTSIFEMVLSVRNAFDIKDNTIIYTTIGVENETLSRFIIGIKSLEEFLNTGIWTFEETLTQICFFINTEEIIKYKRLTGEFIISRNIPYEFYFYLIYHNDLNDKIKDIFLSIISTHIIKHITKKNYIFDDRCLTNLKK